MNKFLNDDEIKNEANRCLNCNNPRCMNACPLGNNIPKMMSKIKEGKFEEALEIDKETNPLGTICGLICSHEKQCEGSCVRGIKDKPVKIGLVEASLCAKNLKEKKISNNIENDIENHSSKTVSDNNQEKELNSNEAKVAIVGRWSCWNFLCVFFSTAQNSFSDF